MPRRDGGGLALRAEIWRLFVQCGHSIDGIVVEMTSRGVKTDRGGRWRAIGRAAVEEFLREEFRRARRRGRET